MIMQIVCRYLRRITLESRCRNIDHKRTRRDFIKIQQKISNNMACQKVRVLSQAGKTALIKLNYMFIFTIYGINNNISKEIDSYFWRNKLDYDSDHTPIPLISWDKYCKQKYLGKVVSTISPRQLFQRQRKRPRL